MRTLVDLPEKEMKRLTELSKERKVSRAHLLRCAVTRFLEAEDQTTRRDTLDKLAGLWADRDMDGLEYQLAMRREWDREF